DRRVRVGIVDHLSHFAVCCTGRFAAAHGPVLMLRDLDVVAARRGRRALRRGGTGNAQQTDSAAYYGGVAEYRGHMLLSLRINAVPILAQAAGRFPACSSVY